MLAQGIYGPALGYEALNDHDQVRHDPLLGLPAGKRQTQQPLAGKSTLNRLELSTAEPTRDQKIDSDPDAIGSWSTCFLKPSHHHPGRPYSISMPPICPSPATRNSGSSTATSTATITAVATCRSTSSAASTYCVPASGPPIRTPPPAVLRRSNASWRRSGKLGRRCR
ncbi:MAG: transposase [Acidobacteriaceae bacterium]|nr:transposase [Acidobacteriaceae bacterium]